MFFMLLAGAMIGGMWYSTRLLPSLAKGVQTVRKGCSLNAPESFDTFLPRYQSDRMFANARTTDPLETVIGGPDGPATTMVPRTDYRNQELLGDIVRKHGMAVRKEAGKVELEAGPVTYRFRLQAGCWELWQAES
ncbi:hypothetical protein SAMN05518865_103106 [Duganella sp. CF458]|uniref:hypothetical protein n=1 Tax=Duganella sp. CF458 TaxID=1884368 RepID=UPI0008F43AFF|nr:hypothetical protein [Duganella sp. CF458]SFF67755.1 hypothetical protein SAMN05518865_103106 [Duganella sp. CF458]